VLSGKAAAEQSAYFFEEASNPNHLIASLLTVPSAIAPSMAVLNMSAKS
jgi:hypothetical protein